ncbi:MAG: bifunctional diaminohydroxyphosphoribosylaminopyrimidine deaminase/5-amino-6-(5-phosphoribosylamino)uracil reductase RibD [Myxococcota bacterium]|nr:bifunctional diaminohydroxyphosphoribosylaminopyrimidine deaminase/5-amino-6-(5-phosphoribosylamino)uracil reductase RibD [Myxococcota bacterium]
MEKQATFMEEALVEAEKGRGRTGPNPMVGCVVVKKGNIVGRGHHAKAGGLHAEVAALEDAGRFANGADIYVTLEPCNHFGHTPPCTDALIKAGVNRVFVGMRDPNEFANGRAIRRLRKAGIGVETGILRNQCIEQNEAFSHFIKTHRPWVVAKMAQTLDGKVATDSGESKWITGKESRRYGHRLRNELDGILVGVGTVLADNPLLTCRVRGGRDPIRIILDTQARSPLTAACWRVGKRNPGTSLIFCSERAPKARTKALNLLAGVQVIAVPEVKGRVALGAVLDELGRRDLTSILVEGGPTVLGGFFSENVVDKCYTFIAPMIIGGEGLYPSVRGKAVSSLMEASRFRIGKVERLGSDTLICSYSQ